MARADLASILATVTSPGAAPVAAPTDTMGLMMAMFQQQQAAAAEAKRDADARAEREDARRREEKADTMKMLMGVATLVLPKLLDKPAMDPLVIKMLENSSNKEAMQQFLSTSSQLNQQSSQMFMQQLATMMGTMGDMQSRMTERQIDMMEERMAKMAAKDDDDETDSPMLAIVKAALPAILGEKAAPVGAAVVGAVAAQAAPSVPVPVASRAVAVVNPPAVTVSPDTARKVKIMQMCMALHLRGEGFTEEKRQQFYRALVTNVARADDVARAILADDQMALLGALKPAVEAEPPLGQWIGTVEAQTAVAGLIGTVVKPGLEAIGKALREKAEREENARKPQDMTADA